MDMDFCKDASSTRGFDYWCKKCKGEAAKESRKKDPRRLQLNQDRCRMRLRQRIIEANDYINSL